MRVAVWSGKRLKKGGMLLVCGVLAVMFLCVPEAMQNGVRRGMAICSQILVPSLFPFLVLAGFVVRSGLADALGRRLAMPFRWLCGCTGSGAVAMLVSLIGGYPAGASAVVQLCERGEIEDAEGRRLLRCCVSAGPAFVIGGIGVGMLGSVKAGVLLLAAHWLAFWLVAWSERGACPSPPRVCVPSSSVGAALAQSVNTAASSLLSMCGFVLLASGLLSLADALGMTSLPPFVRCLAACVAEVSTGCTEAASMGALTPFWLGAALGFGGLSVHGQIAAITAPHRWVDGGFWRARIRHALVGGGLSMLLFWRWHPSAMTASTALSAFATDSTVGGMSGLVAMLVLCVLFLWTCPAAQI